MSLTGPSSSCIATMVALYCWLYTASHGLQSGDGNGHVCCLLHKCSTIGLLCADKLHPSISVAGHTVSLQVCVTFLLELHTSSTTE